MPFKDEVNNTLALPARGQRGGGDFPHCMLSALAVHHAQANGEQMCSDKYVPLTGVSATGQTAFVQRNIQVCSCNHCRGRRATGITGSECVSAALRTEREIRVRHVVMRCLPRSTIFSHIISQTARFSGEKNLNTKCVFSVSLQLLSAIFLILRRTKRDLKNKRPT